MCAYCKATDLEKKKTTTKNVKMYIKFQGNLFLMDLFFFLLFATFLKWEIRGDIIKVI